MSLQGNKGEWGELYVFLRLLGEGRLQVGDATNSPKDDEYYEVYGAFRRDPGVGDLSYMIDAASEHVLITVSDAEISPVEVAQDRFKQSADTLLERMGAASTPSFAVGELGSFLESCLIVRLNAQADGSKTDLRLRLGDRMSPAPWDAGFSIKSSTGSPATLLNPGRTTMITYRVVGDLNPDQVEDYNQGGCRRPDLIQLLGAAGAELEFLRYESPVFESNLFILDANLPVIVANALRIYHLGGKPSIEAAIAATTEMLSSLGVPGDPDVLARYKWRQLLGAAALGMVPDTPWSGAESAHGGYINVLRDGTVITHHAQHRGEFEEYLVGATKLESPSKTRYGYGRIEQDGKAGYTIKLCLQIRFK